ncbi:hypothetical protein GCM10010372_03790 [Streptomyces tauricus]|nr:hypothetical protein GCM10010372_03790 [Streptomyces tauricus]
MLADEATHWRFEVRECVAVGGDTAAFGVMAGRLPDGVRTAKVHLAGAITGLSEPTLVHPPVEGSPEACLRVTGCPPPELPPGAVLLAAECGISACTDRALIGPRQAI